MAHPSSASPIGTRPYNAALLTTFALLSAGGAWFMRIYIIINDAPVGFNDVLASGTHPNGVPIKKHYTDLKPLDEGLSMLVTAFLPGAAGWSEAFYCQQFHFLVQISAIISIMTVEACREKNQGSWLKYTSVFAFLYQNIGGAVVIPIWLILFHRISGQNSYFQSGRAVPIPYARLILPSLLLIYFVPTIAIFVPRKSLETLQNILAFWQLTPIFINIPLWFAYLFGSSITTDASSKTRNADLPHLKLLYNIIFLVSVLSHWYTIFMVVSSDNPSVTLARVFLPSPAHWLTSMDAGLLWIFQWDWIICAALHVLPALIAIYDVQRFLPDTNMSKGASIVTALTVLGGPGAALAGIWGWREERLAIIEEKFTGDRKKKH